MNRALLDNPLDEWEEELSNLRANKTNTDNGFKKCISKLTEDVCGEHAADNQKEHTNNEKKPNDINVNDFSTKLLQMNNVMIVLHPNATKKSTS